MKRALLVLLLLLPSTSFATLRTRIHTVLARDKNGELLLLYVRTTCKKGPDGKPGKEGSAAITGFNVEGEVLDVEFTYEGCPIPAAATVTAAKLFGLSNLTPVSAAPKEPRLALEPTVNPASDRVYLANLGGTNGRSQIDVLDTAARRTVASIDLGDRIFGGLQLSPDGRRLYAVMWQQSLGTSLPPAIFVIDTVTNAVADRMDLPGLLQPQAPAISPDGRYLYFSATADGTTFRLRVADLQQKTVTALPDPVPANTDLKAAALSPDGALLCATGSSSLACYDTRTRTFVGRASASLPNSSLPPVFHPNGRWVYLLSRAFVNNALTIYVSVVNTSTLTEYTRIPITNPASSVFRDNLAVLSIDPTGERLLLDESFSGVLNVIDTRTNRVIKTVEGLTTGGLGGAVVIR